MTTALEEGKNKIARQRRKSFLRKLGLALALLVFYALLYWTVGYYSSYYGTGARIGSIPLYRTEVSHAHVRIIHGTPIATRVLHQRSDQTYASGLGSCNLEDGGAFIRGVTHIADVPLMITEANDRDDAFGFYIPPHQRPSDTGSCEIGFVHIQPDEMTKAFRY